MPNTRNRQNVRALVAILSDAHAEIAATAVRVTTKLANADSRESARSGNGDIVRKWAAREFECLEDLVNEQAQRCHRMRQELIQIRNNIRVA